MSRTLTGSCLCGAVRYEVADEFEYALICHCSQCRRATGAASKPFAGIGRDKLKVTQGADALLQFGGDLAHDIRCKVCGGFLYSVVREARYAHVNFGSLVDEPSIAARAHIFVGSKASWDEILDDFPQFQGFPE